MRSSGSFAAAVLSAASLCVAACISTPAPAAVAPAAGPAVLVAGDATEDATASNNQTKLVQDPAGLTAAYVGAGPGGAQVYLARSTDGGARWGRLAEVSAGPMASRLPAIELDSAGRLHAVWTRYDGGVGKIYYRVWARGRWTGPQQRISPPDGYAGFPGLAVDPAGRPQVVWYGIRAGSVPTYTRHGSIYEIYYTGFDGRAWSAPLLISTGVPDSVNPALAAGAGGRLCAVWYQYDGRTYQVRYAERDGTWSAPETVSHTRSDEFNPDLAVAPSGQAVLVWEHHDGLDSVIHYSRRAGGRWEAPVTLSAGASPARHPSVAVTATGVVYVVWDQDDGQIYGRRDAGEWGPVVRLTSAGGNSFPSAAADGPSAGVIWTHTAEHRSGVYFARLGPR